MRLGKTLYVVFAQLPNHLRLPDEIGRVVKADNEITCTLRTQDHFVYPPHFGCRSDTSHPNAAVHYLA